MLGVDVIKYIVEVDPWRVFVAVWAAMRRRRPTEIKVPPLSPQWLDDNETRSARRGDLP